MKDSLSLFRGQLVTVLALFFSLCGTFFTWHWSNLAVQKKAILVLQGKADHLTSNLDARYQIYTHVLRGMQGLFAASPQVEQKEFETYLKTLNAPFLFSGTLRAAYAEHVSRSDKENFIAQVRTAPGFQSLKQKEFSIHPDGVKNDYFPIKCFFPSAEKEFFFGYDISSDAPLWAAALRAAQTGQPAASESFLVPGGPEKIPPREIMISLPIYKNGTDLSTPELRRTGLQGFVGLVFTIEGFIRDAIDLTQLPEDISFELYDNTNTEKPVLLYKRSPAKEWPLGDAPILKNLKLDIAGRSWTFYFRMSENFGLSPLDKMIPWLVLAAGGLISALITSMIFFLVKAYLLNVLETQGISQELNLSREHLSLALQAAGVSMWDWDIEKDEVTVDENTLRAFGKNLRGTLKLDDFIQTLHPRDRDRVRQEIISSIESESDYETNYHVIRADGAIRSQATHGRIYRNAKGKAVRMTGAAWDITNLKKAEEAIHRSEINYRNMIESSHDGILIVREQEGTILFANHAAIKLFGKGADSLLGTQLGFPIVSEKTSIINLIPPGQKRRIVELNASRAEWEEKAAFLITLRDITERKELEAQFIQAQKMEAVGQLTGGIAHDFNNLLTVINGYSEMQLMRMKDSGPLRSTLEEILKAGKRAAALTSQLLVFSRRQIVQPKVTDLNTLIMDINKMLRRLITENIELTTTLAPMLWPVKIDRSQFEQVIMNLVINARDAMPSGGKLLIETQNTHVTPEHAEQFLHFQPGSYVMLSVSDTGCGMTEEVKKRIFEPFFTTKEQGKGTGLGLATVYGIIKQANAHMNVYSEPGKGTCFKIYIPRVKSDAAEPAEEVPLPEKIQGSETLLVAEDEPQVRALIVNVLTGYGYQVLVASDGLEGAELSKQKADTQIALVITDAVMPRMGGTEMAAEIREHRPGIKVLFISGYTDNMLTEQEILTGKSAFLQKPFSGTELARKVREILDNPET